MKEFFSSCFAFAFDFYFFISVAITAISFTYLYRTFFFNKSKKKKIDQLLRLDPSLETEMNNFRAQKTKLIFHFLKLFKGKIYKYLYVSSQNILIDIVDKDKNEFMIEYIDHEYPYKYNITEEIILVGEKDEKKIFLITINKYIENHYNVIIDNFEKEKTFSLEVIIYSKIKKCLEEIIKMENIKKYIKENLFSNILRFNIINLKENDLLDIYCIGMEDEEKDKVDKKKFSQFKENLLMNIIYSKDEKISFRRIFENSEEIPILYFTKEEINLLKELYSTLIKKYINADLHKIHNTIKFKQEFNAFDKKNNYSSEIDKRNNKEINIISDLRTIDAKFTNTPFFLRNYDKDNISIEELELTEHLCYLNIILMEGDYAIDKIKKLNQQKDLLFKKHSFLSNKDKSLILINLLANQKKCKSNYEFRSFYDLPENSPYIQSELFFRKTVSKLNDNSSLSFLYLQLNSGSGEDLLTNDYHYKIRIIPLLEIKFHLLKEFFYPYFFVFNSNNNILALNNKNTQILSFNESEEIGYIEAETLSKIPDENNMIKLAFLKFHEHAHIKFKGNYDDKLDPRYLLDGDFELIDNKYNYNTESTEISKVGESGNALEFFIFNNYTALEKLMKSKKNLSSLNNVELLIQDNFDELRKNIEEAIKDINISPSCNKDNELNKKYEEKIKIFKDFKNKKISEIRLNDLDIEELYKKH